MNILITVCARGGSKGIPGKNIKLLNGKPLIAYTLRTASQFRELYPNSDIVLSTDSDQIKEVVKKQGIEIDTSYTRPMHLASDNVGKIDVIKDLLSHFETKKQKQYDIILDLDITSPCRNLMDLKTALEVLIAKPEAYNIFSVSPAIRNPYFNMVEERENGYFGLCKEGRYVNRQTTPKVYDLNASFYFYRKSFFVENQHMAITSKSAIYEVPHICFDLDHPVDFEFMSFLLENRKLDFEL
ncbi:MAG: acylneuraminate cytidylyltransferase family protein [Flavisolibacter sp.]